MRKVSPVSGSQSVTCLSNGSAVGVASTDTDSSGLLDGLIPTYPDLLRSIANPYAPITPIQMRPSMYSLSVINLLAIYLMYRYGIR